MAEVRRKLIRRARAIVTCDPQDRVFRDSDILIEGQRITAIGEDLPREGVDEVIDASDSFIYPGLVNTHHHFFQTFIRNLMSVDYPNMSVIDWIDEIYEIFRLVTPDVIQYSTLTALADLARHGCTTAFDHQYCYPRHAGKELVDRQMAAAEIIGVRYHAGRGANTLTRREGSTVPDEMVETTDEFLKDCDRLISHYHDPKPFSMQQIVIAPCQPINCHKETFVESAQFARSRGVRLHTHVGEGENTPMVERWGVRTLAWCEDIGFVGDDVWYAHGWELTPQEYQVMARTRTGLSHCPAPAVLGGFPILDIPAMTRAGMKVSLGCDGSATNDSSNLLDTLRMAYLMQSNHSKLRGGSPTPYQMLRLATVEGAAMLGRTDIGSLSPGMAADLFMIDVGRLDLAGTLHDPTNLLARSGVTRPVDLTMVGGQVIYQHGEFPRFDERELAREAESVCTRDIRQKCSAY